ncbi:MAG TPA: O-antigen ligase family protein [Hyphomicrobiales bacterium]|nr:O-antigen ligase family protein [Hyphomicrobiales bacterium]
MTAVAEIDARPRYTVSIARLQRGMMWLCGFSGFVVFIEPSPYEAVLALAMALFVATGLRLTATHVPLIVLIFFYQLGACITLVQVIDKPDTLTWTLTGIYLALTGIFYALVIAEDTDGRLRALLQGYVVGAVICALIGIPAYFHKLPDYEQFLLYERVRSTFKDPNVFGPFLILPAALLLQRFLTRGLRASLVVLPALGILVIGVFLSFSRAAWGQLVLSAALMTVITFAQSDSPRERRRIVRLAIVGAVLLALFVVALLAIPAVMDLFVQRAALEQPYDAGRLGRFGRHILGFMLALDKPFGIGMLQFSTIFPEDTHNTFLNAFMSYGWLGGVMWPAIVASTLVIGGMALSVRTPWQRAFVCIYASYVVSVGEAWIIDEDHWRHLHLLQGLVWGLAIASRRWRAAHPAAEAPRTGSREAATTTAP